MPFLSLRAFSIIFDRLLVTDTIFHRYERTSNPQSVSFPNGYFKNSKLSNRWDNCSFAFQNVYFPLTEYFEKKIPIICFSSSVKKRHILMKCFLLNTDCMDLSIEFPFCLAQRSSDTSDSESY